MNVLFLDQYGELGGAQRCLLDLLPAVVEAGWTAHVAAPGDGELLARASALGAGTSAIRCGPYTSGRKTAADMARFAVELPRLAGAIRRLAARVSADLVYVNGPRLLPAAALAVGRQRPLLFHVHLFLEGYVRALAGWSLRHARAKAVACSQFVAEPLREFCPVRVVYNGVAPSRTISGIEGGADYPSTRGLPTRPTWLRGGLRPPTAPSRSRLGKTGAASDGAELTVGVIGRISPQKGQAEFLRAAGLLMRDLPKCRFVICGAPVEESLRTLAEGLPVEFTGWKSNTEEVFASLDLLVVPSMAVEAAPRVILESFAAGVPVMAFGFGGIPELIEHDATGFLVEERTAEALARGMLRVLRDEPHRLGDVAARALRKVQEDFSLARYRRGILESMKGFR